MTAGKTESPHPLCVDMDGTLLRTDSLDECFWAAVSQEPLLLFKLPVWLVRGRAAFKARMAPYGINSVATWPLRESVMKHIREAKSSGREVWLVTAADQQLAWALAEHLGCFDGVLASDGSTNLKGATKARLLTDRFGKGGFDYIGDSRADTSVWEQASRGFCVMTEDAGTRWLPDNVDPLTEKSPRLLDWLREMRVHQWSKNALLLMPMLAAHAVLDLSVWLTVLAGILCMSLVASGTYFFNDCLDLDGDRRMPAKRDRPLARGDLSLRKVILVGFGLVVAGMAGAVLTDPYFALLLLGYAATSVCYSSFLKRLLLIDVLMLSGFYVWRLIMGGVLANVPLSPWFLGFALFFFVSVALAKRYAELMVEHREGVVAQLRRPYRQADLPVILAFGVGSSLVTVLVL
ncbi:MAG TPA: UbiA family prenyltransferase, partial [Oceanipulchritudo sp.]|nr:UbiA family prenyltransferase [Oceanipulchritudo sp.]